MQHVVVFEAPRNPRVVCNLMQGAAAAFKETGLDSLHAYVAPAAAAYVVVAFREGAELPAVRLAEFVEAATWAGARIVEKTPDDLLMQAQRGELAFFFGAPTDEAVEALFEESKQCNQLN